MFFCFPFFGICIHSSFKSTWQYWMCSSIHSLNFNSFIEATTTGLLSVASTPSAKGLKQLKLNENSLQFPFIHEHIAILHIPFSELNAIACTKSLKPLERNPQWNPSYWKQYYTYYFSPNWCKPPSFLLQTSLIQN